MGRRLSVSILTLAGLILAVSAGAADLVPHDRDTTLLPVAWTER